MRARRLCTMLAPLAATFVFGGCEPRSVPVGEPPHSQAETAAAVVEKLATAAAAYWRDVEERDVEVQPVGLVVDSWRFIPDRGLAEAMATLPLPVSAPGEKLSPAPWTIRFYKTRHPDPVPGEVLAVIVDGAYPFEGLTFGVVVEPDGTVGDAYHTGWMSRGVERK